MKKIGYVGFGGTIAMVVDPEDGSKRPAKSATELLELVPTLAQHAELTIFDLENRDSTNINPSHWTKLALWLQEHHSDFDGIIVSHGTDTMAYTATAVALALGRGLKIPIVFTGSQVELVGFGTDARFNLENTMITVLKAIELGVAEVLICFHDVVLRGARAIKTSESHFSAFDSPAFPHIARIDSAGVHFIPDVLRQDESKLDLTPHFQRGIMSLEVVPGLEPGILSAVLHSGKCQGLLLKSLGAGNVPSEEEFSLLPVIEEAVRVCKVPVLVSTKFVGGRTHMDTYKPGKMALEAGAIPTGDMTDVAAQVKFMWALAQGHRDPDTLRKVINTSFVGEIAA